MLLAVEAIAHVVQHDPTLEVGLSQAEGQAGAAQPGAQNMHVPRHVMPPCTRALGESVPYPYGSRVLWFGS